MQAGHRGRTAEARAGLEALLRGSPGGTRLPGERELAQNLGVARMTLRAAMDDLVVAGRIARRPGSGTFVTHTSVAKDARLTSFSQDMAARGMTASSKVLAVDRRAASRALALDLRIPVGDPVHRVHRLRLGDGDPIALETVWLPVAYAPDLVAAEVEGSLYEVLDRRFGIRPVAATTSVSAVTAAPREAELLGIPVTQPCLLIQLRGTDRRGRPVIMAHCLYNGDRYQMRMAMYDAPEREVTT